MNHSKQPRMANGWPCRIPAPWFAAMALGALIGGNLATANDGSAYQAYPLHRAHADQVETVLAPLMPPGTELVADRRGNRILVRGSPQSQEIAQRAVQSLDKADAGEPGAKVAPAGEPVLKVYPCPAGKAAATATALQAQWGRLPGVRIVADERTSQVLVLAPPEVQAKVSAYLGALNPPSTDQERPTQGSVPTGGGGPVGSASPPTAGEVLLTRLTTAQLESALAGMLGARLSRVTPQVPQTATYSIRLNDGSEIGLLLERQGNRVAFQGPAAACASLERLIRALDAGERGADQSMRLVPLKTTRAPDVRRAVDAISVSNVPREDSAAEGRPAADRGVHLAARLFQPAKKAEEGAAPGAEKTQTAPKSAATQPKPPSPGPGAVQGLVPGAQVSQEEGGGLIGPVQIELLEGLDVLVIRGNRRDVQQVVEIIQQIEKLSAETEPAIEVYALGHVDCTAMANLVNQLYVQVYQARQGAVTILPLVKPNALLLVGRRENVDRAISLVKLLDVPVSPETQFQVFRLKHASAATAQTMIESFYADRGGLGPVVRVTSDIRSNSLVVQASRRDLAEVAAMIDRIDTPTSEAVNELRVFKLSHSLATDLAQTLTDAIQSQVAAVVPGAPAAAAAPTAAAARTAGQRASMLQFVTIDAQGQRRLSSGILTDVRITSDVRANTLIVSAPAESMPLLEALIKQLDQPPAVRAEIKVFTVENSDALALVDMLMQFFGQAAAGAAAQPGLQTAAREGESSLVPLRFAADARTNSIIASGTASDLLVVEAMLVRLDSAEVKNRQSMVYRLKNAPATDVANAIDQFLRTERQVEAYPGLLSPFEQIEREVVVVPEPVSNALIISATPRYFDEIKKLVEQLDQRPPMVMIQVLIGQVELGNTDEFGVELGLQDGILFNRGRPPSPGFLFNSATLGNDSTTTALERAQFVAGQGLSNLGVGRTNNELGFGGLVLTASSESVSVLVRALKENRRLEILARPQIMTLDNQTAYIQVGQLVPTIYGVTLTQFGQTNNVRYQETGLILGVTPRISPDGLVVMEIDANRSDVGPESEGIPIFVSTQGTIIRSPRINRTLAQTTVSASDGQTVVLGGLISNQQTDVTRKVPLLADVPVVGNLFKYTSKAVKRTELLVIMTPHVIRNEADAEAMKRTEVARMHWCLGDVIDMTGDIGLSAKEASEGEDQTQVIYPDGDPNRPAGKPGTSPQGSNSAPAPMPPKAIPSPGDTPFQLESPSVPPNRTRNTKQTGKSAPGLGAQGPELRSTAAYGVSGPALPWPPIFPQPGPAGPSGSFAHEAADPASAEMLKTPEAAAASGPVPAVYYQASQPPLPHTPPVNPNPLPYP